MTGSLGTKSLGKQKLTVSLREMKILFNLPTLVELVIQNLFVETDFHQSMYSCPLVSSILLLQAWPVEDYGPVNHWNLYKMTMIEFGFL